MDTLAEIFSWVRQFVPIDRGLEIVWHSGEPLVVGRDYFSRALVTIREILTDSVNIQHVVQTNGTLIDRAWCQFFRANGIKLGVSLDGPAAIHDLVRRDRAGNGTFARTAAGIRLLREEGVPFTVLTVLTAASLSDPDGLWECYRALGIQSVAFNVEEVEGANSRSSLQGPGAEARFRMFLRRILQLWYELPSEERPRIREIDWFLGSLYAEPDGMAAQTNTPFEILSFDLNGRVSTFSPELLATRDHAFGDFTFGDVRLHSLESIKTQSQFATVSEAIARGIARCRHECEYFAFCGGGPPVNKLCENGTFDSTETMYCRLRVKTAADEMLTFFEANLESQQHKLD